MDDTTRPTPNNHETKVKCLMPLADRRQTGIDDCADWRGVVEKRFTDGSMRMQRIEDSLAASAASLAENTASTKRVEINTADLVEGFENLKAAFKVLNWIGRAARPLGYIAAFFAAVVSLWVALKSGSPK